MEDEVAKALKAAGISMDEPGRRVYSIGDIPKSYSEFASTIYMLYIYIMLDLESGSQKLIQEVNHELETLIPNPAGNRLALNLCSPKQIY